MKKKVFIITLVISLIIMMTAGAVWAEGEGENAHSQSMSAESGEQPIEDIESTEDQIPADPAAEEAGSGENLTDEGQEDPDSGWVDEDKEGAPDANAEDPAPHSRTKSTIAIALCCAVLVIILAILLKMRKRCGTSARKAAGKGGYKGKHSGKQR